MSKKIAKVVEVSAEDAFENEVFENVVEEIQVELEQSHDLQNQVQKPKVGARCKQLLLEGNLSNKDILEQIKQEYPEAKTSIACIAWYKSDLKKTKVDVDAGYKAWLKLHEKELRAEFEAELLKAAKFLESQVVA